MKKRGKSYYLMESMKYGMDLLKPISNTEFEIEISDDFAGYFIGKNGAKIRKYRGNIKINEKSNEKRILVVKGSDPKYIGQVLYRIHEYNCK